MDTTEHHVTSPAPHTVLRSMAELLGSVKEIPENVMKDVLLAGTEISVIGNAARPARITSVTKIMHTALWAVKRNTLGISVMKVRYEHF